MICIGLTGKAGAGKSTVADYLVEAHGFTRLSFAAPLKKMLRTLDPILDRGAVSQVRLSDAAVFSDESQIKQLYPEYRRLLQVLGTDCIRAVDEEFWVKAAMKQLTDDGGRYVFDDVRFPNEASAVYMAAYDHRPALWHIDRPGHDAGAGTHTSEQHAGKMGETLTIVNYSSKLGPLHEQIDYTMAQHFEGVLA